MTVKKYVAIGGLAISALVALTSSAYAYSQPSAISEENRSILVSAYQEERMAHDVYVKMSGAFPSKQLDNVIASEAQHMASVKRLLDRYGVAVPEGYGKYETLFAELSAKAVASKKDALEVGVAIETTDIRDIAAEIRDTDDAAIRSMLSRIGGASFNHLRMFVRMANGSNVAIETPYSGYLSQSEVDSRGNLSYKMSDFLNGKTTGTLANSVSKNGNGRGFGKRGGRR